MNNTEAIQTLQLARAEVEWEYPIDIAAALDLAIAALERERPKRPYESLARGLKEAIEYEKGRVALPSNTMSISELEVFSPSDIKSIRNHTGLSQSAFAAAMGVSKKAVEAWEQGRNKPVGPARRVLALLEEDPKFFERTGVVVMEEMCNQFPFDPPKEET